MTPPAAADRQAGLHGLLTLAPVVPVLVIESVGVALPLARALLAGGLPVLEITLRTPAALEVIRALVGELEGAVVGAGTVLTPAQYRDAERAGARFVVSPGATPLLLEAAAASPVPFLPGAATAGEVMRLLEHGCRCLKFFPAEPAGGIAYLKALASPLPEARFCPTGGIDAGARAELSQSTQRALRRRLLGRARRCRGGRRLAENHRTRARRRGAEGSGRVREATCRP